MGLINAVARPLRIEFSGAWYHVMNRVSGRSRLFKDAICHQIFLEVLSELHQKFQVEFHAYCLMSNHYHLLLRTPHPNLGKAMRHFGVQFTRKINQASKRDGPIFRGRYKAILVDADNYLIQLSRYIHLNPCVAKIVKDPKDYSWSSYPVFIRICCKPEWLYCDETLQRFSSSDPILEYKTFVLEGLNSREMSLYEDKARSSILGSDSFKEKVARSISSTNETYNATGCLELKKRLMPTLNIIIERTANFFVVTINSMVKKKNKKKDEIPRNFAILLAAQLSGRSHPEIAIEFEGLSGSAVSQICRRLKVILGKDAQLLEKYNELKQICHM